MLECRMVPHLLCLILISQQMQPFTHGGASHDNRTHDEPYTTLENVLKTRYDARRLFRSEVPGTAEGTHIFRSLPVQVNIYVYSFSSISVEDMDYTIDILLRQRWIDGRLKNLIPRELGNLPIATMKDKLWLPDLFFRNSKYGFVHQVTQPNYMLWLNADGLLTFSQKLSMKASCPMELSKFPMDTQKCKLNIGSYGYTMDYLHFLWWDNAGYKIEGQSVTANSTSQDGVTLSPNVELTEFKLESYNASYCNKGYSNTGSFTCIEIEFILHRRFGFYMLYVYLPSILIVLIAWLSFFIDASAIPARVSIGLLCVLAIITHSAAILDKLPRVSYIKSIDIWVFICLSFVVSSLLEFAMANSISRRQAKMKCTQPAGPDGANEDKSCDTCKPKKADRPSSPLHTSNPHVIDYIFAIGYPLMFALFNVIYWVYFLRVTESNASDHS